jgi:hypothetical protein
MMKVKVSGKTAINERCVCRHCGHYFMTQDAVAKADAVSGELVNGLSVCCPACFSDDVTERLLP